MRSMRTPVLAGALAAAAFAVTQSATADQSTQRDYVVVYKQGAGAQDARAAIAAAGGRIVNENAEIGVATVRSTDASFEDRAAQQSALEGAAPETPIGQPAAAAARPPGPPPTPSPSATPSRSPAATSPARLRSRPRPRRSARSSPIRW